MFVNNYIFEIDRKNIYCVGIDKCEKALEIAKKILLNLVLKKTLTS